MFRSYIERLRKIYLENPTATDEELVVIAESKSRRKAIKGLPKDFNKINPRRQPAKSQIEKDEKTGDQNNLAL